jgi:protein AroM
MRRLGTITPGQAPRADLVPMLDAALPDGVARIDVGILDGLSRAAIEETFAPEPGGAVIVARIADGSFVVMDKAKVKRGIQTKIDALEAQGCDAILVLCTGDFDGFQTACARLIEPEKILIPTLTAMTDGAKVGVFVPLAAQIATEGGKWSGFAQEPLYAAVSPYNADDEALEVAARDLATRGAELLMTDCMGFVEHHRAVAARASGLPVILASTLVVKLAAEMV